VLLLFCDKVVSGEQPKKKKKKQKHIHRHDVAAAAGTSVEPVSDVLAVASVLAAPSPQGCSC
jgi:hypothetical protein